MIPRALSGWFIWRQTPWATDGGWSWSVSSQPEEQLPEAAAPPQCWQLHPKCSPTLRQVTSLHLALLWKLSDWAVISVTTLTPDKKRKTLKERRRKCKRNLAFDVTQFLFSSAEQPRGHALLRHLRLQAERHRRGKTSEGPKLPWQGFAMKSEVSDLENSPIHHFNSPKNLVRQSKDTFVHFQISLYCYLFIL